MLLEVKARPLRLAASTRAAPRGKRVQRDLVTTDAKVLKVALDAGFGSLSRFNAAFRAYCGYSPREYRPVHRL